MNIYLKQRPDSLDLCFPNHDPKDTKMIHQICRKHWPTYGGHRWNKEHQMIEFHAEQDIGPWDLERLWAELEQWAYPEPELKTEETQTPPADNLED